ncbi:MAG: phospho-N-acetylmuramoyl-pentapeptide-transferase [Oscillospiraceae bacterium]|nr:phospho-N-acetylmuramoyl-pentapeptide-transferase [Oscillospiraceae bacterium]
MIFYLFGIDNLYLQLLLSAVISFVLTFGGIELGSKFLPKDQGREFAVNGALSKGKARGAGIILMIAFILASVLCVPLSIEYMIYLAAIFLEMMSGYLDDAAKVPWGELKKGLIDLVVSAGVSVTYYFFHGGAVTLPLFGLSFEIPMVVYIILGIILIWASINVTNCSDGVDGLCASLSTVTLTSALLLISLYVKNHDNAGNIVPEQIFVWMVLFVLIAYLWFNCSPSRILMGDAGSRAIGLIIALAFMLSGMPFMFIPCALMLIIDGGLGLVKLTVLRVTKSKTFMKNIRTPIHDHARKNKGWSDTQVVTRFTLIQLLLSAAFICTAYFGSQFI